MRTSDFDYDLPPELIAQTPIEPRDASRLLVVNRASGELAHRHFRDIGDYLRPGDLLVANRSRVIPARLAGHKADSGGAIETLLLARRPDLGPEYWETLVRPGRRIREGQELLFSRPGAGTNGQPILAAIVVSRTEAGGRILRFTPPASGEPLEAVLARLGSMPLPPYIRAPLENPERYQTVYSREPGSAAAPTAGLHFTPELLAQLGEQGVETAFVLLHVGLDTFRPVEEENPSDHKMHSEAFALDEQAAAQINAARARGGRVIAVGTTSVRVLESLPDAPTVAPCQGRTALFITPGYQFRLVDALITNFHLPRSSLLMLVSAFVGAPASVAAGADLTRRAYAEAIARRYRFFSFGDAMLIL
ncbi:MAG TPA: tRNA preQ1(34) S-adenosylmethionine ribosyltransferase-isomerase QueA [Ktedonobacterales bacterium]|jgi:S-adenosylmethionine:tRNA ribosyltransferase-isomerase